MRPLTILAAVLSNSAIAVLTVIAVNDMTRASSDVSVPTPKVVVVEKTVETPVLVPQPIKIEVPLNDDVMCLAHNIYHEARGENREGQIQVAFTTLNRVGKRNWPDTICGVVFQRKQFSWTLEKPYMDLRGLQERNAYRRAIDIATKVLSGEITNNMGADHYYAPAKVDPVWAKQLSLVGDVGGHRFMR